MEGRKSTARMAVAKEDGRYTGRAELSTIEGGCLTCARAKLFYIPVRAANRPRRLPRITPLSRAPSATGRTPEQGAPRTRGG